MISSSDEAAQLDETSTNVLIIDDDGMYSWSVTSYLIIFPIIGAQVSISVDNDGIVDESIGAVSILVTLTGEIDRDVTVTITTSDGTGKHIITCLLKLLKA